MNFNTTTHKIVGRHYELIVLHALPHVTKPFPFLLITMGMGMDIFRHVYSLFCVVMNYS